MMQKPDWSLYLFPSSLGKDYLLDDFAFYQHWIEAGHHAEMSYLASERHTLPRANPAMIWPELKSILTARIPYPHPDSIPFPTDTPPRGRIASYAWVADYHRWLPEKLAEVMSTMAPELGDSFRWKVFTDSAPILERSLAQMSGQGWIGKNSCLITPGVGSFHFLAEVFTNQEPTRLAKVLPGQSEAITDRCGTCQRCIKACPTGCINTDRSIDSNRCISYLTIEHKGMIPIELREKVGNWIFGCDVCQQVCPWNVQFADRTAPVELALPDPYPDLVRELELSDVDFKLQYGSSPVNRAKRRGYLRNVCIALGNVGELACVPSLLRVLQSEPEPLIRAAAVWAISRIDLKGAIERLQGCRQKEIHPLVLDEFELAFR